MNNSKGIGPYVALLTPLIFILFMTRNAGDTGRTGSTAGSVDPETIAARLAVIDEKKEQAARTLEDFGDIMYPQALGDAWSDYQFAIGEDVYLVGSPLYTYLEAGWEANFNVDGLLEPNTRVLFVMGDGALTHPDYPSLTLTGTLYNESMRNTLPMRYCNVVQLNFTAKNLGDVPVRFCGDAALGQTLEELTGHWGKPRNSEEGKSPATYYAVQHQWAGLGAGSPRNSYVNVYYNSDEMVTGITMVNMEEMGWANLFGEPVDGPHAQALLAAYTAPDRMSGDLADGTYTLGGDLYRFPTPVAAFYENGWSLHPDSAGKTIGSKSRVYIKLERGQESFQMRVRNFANGVVTPDFAFAVEIDILGSMPGKPPLVLPLGLTFGTAEGDIPAGYEQYWSHGNYRAGESLVYYRLQYSDGAVSRITMETLVKYYHAPGEAPADVDDGLVVESLGDENDGDNLVTESPAG